MKYVYHIILLFFILPLLAWGECDTLFYMHRLNLPDTDGISRLSYLDSLLSAKKTGRDSLLINKIETSYSLGLYEVAANAYENLMTEYPSGRSLSESLKLQLYYIHGLHYKRRFADCITQCNKMLRTHKPDSLRYYDTLVDAVLVGFNRQSSVSHTQEYIDKNELLLKKAEKNNWPQSTIENIKYGCYIMKMQAALQKGNFKEALNYAGATASLPLSENRRRALSTNMAYIYMMLGKYDVAEECFKELLENSEPTYNKGVSLLNYTHLLNLQGRYKETLEVLDRYKDAEACLENDMYSSYLLGNRAIAESKVSGYEKAFNTLLRSKDLGDSIAYSLGIQDGLLMLEHSQQSAILETLEQKLEKERVWLCIIAVMFLVACTVIIRLFQLLRKNNSRNKSLMTEFDNLREKYNKIETAYSEMTQEEGGKVATQLLQVATLENIINRVQEIIRNKKDDASEKLSLIEELITSAEAKRDGREMFERHFEQAHARFFRNLYAAHPGLTPGEVRMCGYLIMNLSNKEIAGVTSKSIRSVESTRYRIGKKLDIPEGESILSYLRRFLE
ncbi:MAG: hypothetical protein K2K26_12405 [Muribaculaceae bacterium]|nr:hypothetical protein [Muribaculaceae bacterium]